MDDAGAVGERRFVPPAAEAERGAGRERLPVIRPPVLLGPEEVIVVLVLGAHERAEHEGPSVLRRDRRGRPRRDWGYWGGGGGGAGGGGAGGRRGGGGCGGGLSGARRCRGAGA